MTVQRFFYEGFGSEEQLISLKESKAFPLVRELEFKYGLKVLQEVSRGGWQMVNKYGIAVCKVFAENVHNTNGSIQTTYSYRSPFYKKARGDSLEDKETIRSIKVSSLMSTLSRMSVVPSVQDLETRKVANVKDAISQMSRALGNPTKQNPFTADEVQGILMSLLGENPSDVGLSIDLDKCKITLDEYKEKDRIRANKREEIMRVYKNPFHMIGVDEFRHFLVGKFKLTKIEQASNTFEYETIEPFKRHKTYEEVPEIVAMMTMIKVAYENTDYRKFSGFPMADTYNVGLDTAFCYKTHPTHYDHLWMVTPCSVV